jgi:5,10-methylenetetrahydromethanopterin reductase
LRDLTTAEPADQCESANHHLEEDFMKLGVLDMTVNRGGLADVTLAARQASEIGAAGFWVPNFFGLDALTTLTVVGQEVPSIALGTAVVPVFGRHPRVLAQQARTVQAAIDNRLQLGIGLSHRSLVEDLLQPWPVSPVAYLEQYLSQLCEMCRVTEAPSDATATTIRVVTERPVPVLCAALGPNTLAVAGRHADGVVLWSVGPNTVAQLTLPTLQKSASAAGRPTPSRIVLGVPIVVTDDEPAARDRIARQFGAFETMPSYRAALEREHVASIADIALVGSPTQVAAGMERFETSGVTELLANDLASTPQERLVTRSFLAQWIVDNP